MWAYDASPVEEVFPLPSDPYFFDVTLRGLARIILALDVYVHQPPRPTIDGGYYTKTRENRPLIGPVGPRGSFVLGALSGYGIMAACGAAELLAAPGSCDGWEGDRRGKAALCFMARAQKRHEPLS
ncbi:hypothetical protein [Roseiflexus sp.]|uniref:hypothetical protein n=1 Tax=Roseiflexus sp. TaxID=2562120 RepID=UPI00398BAEDA